MAGEFIIGMASHEVFCGYLVVLRAGFRGRTGSAESGSAKQTSLEEDAASRITLDVTRVNMLFTVSDKKGRFVTDLNRRRF